MAAEPHTSPETPAEAPGKSDDSGSRFGSWVVVALLLVALNVAAVVLGFRMGERRGDGPPPSTENFLASFQFEDLETGEPLSSEELRGKVVLVDFWATWCAPCHVQAKILRPVFEDFEGEEDVVFLAVSVGEDRETVASFVADSPFPYPVLLDQENVSSIEGGVTVLPTVFVLDRDGSAVWSGVGVHPGRKIKKVIQETLAAGNAG